MRRIYLDSNILIAYYSVDKEEDSKKMDRADMAEIESQLVSERRVQQLRIHFVEVSPDEEYDFTQFFYHVQQSILKYHSGVGDVIHSVIMKNNGITEILTFDEKD